MRSRETIRIPGVSPRATDIACRRVSSKTGSPCGSPSRRARPGAPRRRAAASASGPRLGRPPPARPRSRCTARCAARPPSAAAGALLHRLAPARARRPETARATRTRSPVAVLRDRLHVCRPLRVVSEDAANLGDAVVQALFGRMDVAPDGRSRSSRETTSRRAPPVRRAPASFSGGGAGGARPAGRGPGSAGRAIRRRGSRLAS